MRIGLVRHFEVDKPHLEGLIRSRDFSKWMKEYDYHDVFPKEVDLRDIDWNKCYASDLSRAVTTAKTIYKGDIIQSKLIREIGMQFTDEFDENTKRMQRFHNWSIYSMLSWAKDNNSIVKETVSMSRERVNKFLDDLFEESLDSDNILLVCHGMIMTVLDDELRKRGFTGDRVVAAENGEMFVFEK